jgi:hypothetical protein
LSGTFPTVFFVNDVILGGSKLQNVTLYHNNIVGDINGTVSLIHNGTTLQVLVVDFESGDSVIVVVVVDQPIP